MQELKGHAPSYPAAIPSQHLHNGPLEAHQISKPLMVACPHWWNENNAQRSRKRKETIILLQGRHQVNISNGDTSQSKVPIRGDDLQQIPIQYGVKKSSGISKKLSDEYPVTTRKRAPPPLKFPFMVSLPFKLNQGVVGVSTKSIHERILLKSDNSMKI